MEGFDPTKHLRNVKGNNYLDVKWRIMWFRSEHPTASIVTEVKDVPGEYAVAKAVIAVDGKTVSTAHKRQVKDSFFDYLEKAETGAIGRALANFGYGTQFTSEDESGHIVDAPVETQHTGEVEDYVLKTGRDKGKRLRDLPQATLADYLGWLDQKGPKGAAKKDAEMINEFLNG